ncbi:GNAT family N-acetyltransferase [Pseudomonas sp. 15FMM2]|uniref:GNAT family N-acetyltransferase n=1 Tax=Pseudomonas imrae TaxID=2992837 RepID=A0ACC7PB93_9PSED
MIIRTLKARDAEAYRALMLEAYGAYPQAFTSSVTERAAMPLDWWEKRLESPLDHLLGAYVGDELAGIVGLAFESREQSRHKVTLFGMYVSDAHQQQGLGLRLVEAALIEARQHLHLKVIQLTVTAGNDAAFALYRRCGFIQYGLEPLAVRVGVDYFDKIHMWRELESN